MLAFLFREVIKYLAKNCCLLLLEVCPVSLPKMLHFIGTIIFQYMPSFIVFIEIVLSL